jgi:hypothetical protein
MKSMNETLEKSSGHPETILAELKKLKAAGKKYFVNKTGHKRISIDRAIELFEKLCN